MTEEEKVIWTDLFRLHSTFATMGNSEEEWTECFKTFNETCLKHLDHPLILKMAMALYDYLSDQRKGETECHPQETAQQPEQLRMPSVSVNF